MSARVRLLTLGILLAGGISLAVSLAVVGARSPLPSTLTSLFQIVGIPVKLVDRSVSRVIPVSSIDERELGEAIRTAREAAQPPRGYPDWDQLYLDAVLPAAAAHARKPFSYRVFVVDASVPNAMAMPGGVLVVTRGLLDVLQSEDEVVAVLAHEVGHVELGHCFDSVRFELLGRKIGHGAMGMFADIAAYVMAGHAFSKTQEDEADTYAWQVLVASDYSPAGAAAAFESLKAWADRQGRPVEAPGASLFRDYFASHPPLEIRAAKFRAQAQRWRAAHRDVSRYVGRRNLKERSARASGAAYDGEWTMSN